MAFCNVSTCLASELQCEYPRCKVTCAYLCAYGKASPRLGFNNEFSNGHTNQSFRRSNRIYHQEQVCCAASHDADGGATVNTSTKLEPSEPAESLMGGHHFNPAPALTAGALQFPVGETVTQTFARLLGYSVLLGSCFRSTPQIARILRANSAAGVSLTASVAELVAYSITCAYNFRLGYAFSTFGEVAACWVQDIALVALISRYRGNNHKRLAVGAVAFAAYCWWLSTSNCSMDVLRMLQASTISIVAIGGRLPQIVLNIRRGNSGELSIATSALNLAGNMARMFTTLVLTQDTLLLIANAVQGVLNSVLLWQTALYAYQRRQQQLMRTKEDPEDLHNDPRDEGEETGVIPAALEATEDAESSEGAEGTSSATAGEAAAAAAASGADGSYGGGGSMVLELPPGDLSDLGIGSSEARGQD